MAWRAIPGFLGSDFWFPASMNHVVEPVDPVFFPSEECQKRCAATPTCCRWGMRSVRSWEDAKDVADGGLNDLGWVIAGESYSDFVGRADWCTGAGCSGTKRPDLFRAQMNSDKKLMKFRSGTGGKDNTGTVTDKWSDIVWSTVDLVNLPGDGGATSYYMLVIVNNKGIHIYDKDGNLQKTFDKENAVTFLVSDPLKDPTMVPQVAFVTSYSCGVFQEDATGGDLAVESLYHMGTSACVGQRKWSDDTWAGSHGISFANIACAIFASVALVFVVLFVTKKNFHLEVVADEQAQLL